MSRYLITAVVASVFQLVAANVINAEEASVEPHWKERLDASDWVSFVRIESIHSLVNPALSTESGMMAVQGYSYTLSVLNNWKGEAEKASPKLRVDLSDCPILMVLDTDYVLFADKNYRGNWQLKSCEHFMPKSEAASLLSFLNQQ